MRYLFYIIILIPSFVVSQNVGVGTTNPSEKLEVNGIIFTSGNGGIRFPDGTLQTTAAVNGGTSSGPSTPQGMVIDIDGGAPVYGGPVSYASISGGWNIFAASSSVSNNYIYGSPGAPQVSFSNCNVTRVVGKSSSRILLDVASGQVIPSIKVYYLVNGGNGIFYSQIEEYADCVFTSYQLGGAAGESDYVESFSFAFREKCVKSYNVNLGSAAPGSDYERHCWNLATNNGN